MKIILSICLVFLLSFHVHGQKEYKYTVPAITEDGWQVANMSNKLSASDTMHYFLSAMAKEQRKHNIHSFLLVQNGMLMIDEYYGNYNLKKKHDLRSATKSITSLLVGKAIALGHIKDLDDPITMYIDKTSYPEILTGKLKDITIRHLLTMTSGLDCDDWDKKSPGQEDKMYRKRDWIKHLLKLDVINTPGTQTKYCTGGVVLLGEIVAKASGIKFDEFAKRYLFDPLVITDYQWQYFDKNKKTDAGGHLFLRPRDMAKIGQLVLQYGKWKDKEIIPSSWIKTATSNINHLGPFDYGFLWWHFKMPTGTKKTTMVFASGNGGQLIFVFPEYDTVCVFTGGNYNNEKAKTPFYLLNNNILPLLKPNKSSN